MALLKVTKLLIVMFIIMNEMKASKAGVGESKDKSGASSSTSQADQNQKNKPQADQDLKDNRSIFVIGGDFESDPLGSDLKILRETPDPNDSQLKNYLGFQTIDRHNYKAGYFPIRNDVESSGTQASGVSKIVDTKYQGQIDTDDSDDEVSKKQGRRVNEKQSSKK